MAYQQVSPPIEDQGMLLENALAAVRGHASTMRKCLETPGKIMDALKSASSLCAELRASALGPKQYYELYMAVFDALRHLTVHLRDAHPEHHLGDLYELIQYAGNIIPRMYLMITVGTVYMSIPDAPVKDIMKDMMEMSRGVQHPVRGLFLRYYLSGQARDYLPEGDGDGPEGNLSDSISFILTNFVEMNKLWVRLQHQGHSREREQRLKERKELQLLVGSNLVRLSQLVDLETYKSTILGPLLEQVVQCRDVLAQEYLLEVITQVFPDEYHLNTLDQLLPEIAKLNPYVNIKAIVIGIMNRLSTFAERDVKAQTPQERRKAEADALSNMLAKVDLNGKDEPAQTTNGEAQDHADSKEVNGEDKSDIVANLRLFEIFYGQVTQLVEAQRVPIHDIIALLASLGNLALKLYSQRLDYIDQILQYANQKVTQFANSTDLHSPMTQANILELLLAPVRSYISLFTAISLPNYITLLQSQTYQTRRAVAREIAQSILKNETRIRTPGDLEKVLDVFGVIIREGLQQPTPGSGPLAQRKSAETEETLEEQEWLAKIIHYLQGKDNDTQFKLLQVLRKAYAEGADRTKYTVPTIVTAALKLARRYKAREHYEDNWNTQSSAVYKFAHTLITSLYTNVNGCAEISMRLFITCGQVADQTGFEEVAYEFFAQAFTVYEEAISDSRAQFQAVCVFVGVLHGTRNFSTENYDTLIKKCALYGSKLLKKPDQCRAVYLASHLWWATEIRARGEEDATKLYRDGKRVLECLQRALRVADVCMDAAVSVELFVEILNRYLYYFEQQNEQVTVKYLNGLIELIHSNLSTSQDNPLLESPRKHFERTIEAIEMRGYDEVVTKPPSA